MQQKINKKTLVYINSYIVALLAYYMMRFDTFRNDTICNYLVEPSFPMLSGSEFLKWIVSMRYIDLLIARINQLIMFIFGLYPNEYTIYMKITSFILLGYLIAQTYNIFEKILGYTEYNRILHSICIIAFVNPINVGMISWEGGYVHLLAILFGGIIATKMYLKNKYVWALFFSYLATCTYQSYYITFALYVIPIIFITNNYSFCKEAKKSCLRVFAITVVSALIPLIMSKMISIITINDFAYSYSTISKADIVNTLITSRIVELFKQYIVLYVFTYGMMPPFTVCIVLAIVALGVIMSMRFSKEKKLAYIDWFIFLAVTINLPFCIVIMMKTTYMPQRIMVNYFIAVAMALITMISYVVSKTEISVDDQLNEDERKVPLITCFELVVTFFLAISIICTHTVILDYHISMALTKEEVKEIQGIIDLYEEENNIKVNKVVYYIIPENLGGYTYEGYMHRHYLGYIFMERVLHRDWSTVEVLEFFGGRRYEKKELTDEQYRRIFGDIEATDVFNPNKQLVFKGDTLYWAIE